MILTVSKKLENWLFRKQNRSTIRVATQTSIVDIESITIYFTPGS